MTAQLPIKFQELLQVTFRCFVIALSLLLCSLLALPSHQQKKKKKKKKKKNSLVGGVRQEIFVDEDVV
jgi:hypothetical protein